MKEIESKYRLCSRMDFLEILGFLDLEENYVQLENFYIDTKDRMLALQKNMLRLRKGIDWKITMKGPSSIHNNSVFEREETEFTVDTIQAENAITNGKWDEIQEKLGLDENLALTVIAHSTVERHTLEQNNMGIAVDRVMLDDGHEYFEIEVEGQSKKAVQQKMIELLASSGVCANPSVKSKYEFALQHTKL